MDYEKKIKTALNDKSVPLEIKAWLEEQFPEFKESDDEKIRNFLISKMKEVGNVWKEYSAKDIIAWLEKQGKEKPTNKVEPKFKVKYAGSEYNVLEIKDIAGVIFYGIEDEPNHIDYVKAENCKIISGYTIKENGSPYPIKSTVFSEQKPTDKTKPKFHEGDWITYGDHTWKVVEVKPLDYILQAQDGNIVDDMISYVDKVFHSFTIEDAKDGDVLVVDNIIFIYKRILSSHIVSYCKLINDKFEHFEDARTCCEGNAYVHPATKEQRDLLFTKMKEAGYKWDAEKKVLKELVTSYCKEYCKGYKETGGKCYFGFDCTSKREAEQKLAHQEVTKVSDQETSEWSEEDTEILSMLINLVECKEESMEVKVELVDWLKSIKSRVQPQTKQEWKPSDELIHALERSADYLHDYGKNDDDLLLLRLLEELKKLQEE